MTLVCVPRNERVRPTDVDETPNEVPVVALRQHVSECALVTRNEESVVTVEIDAPGPTLLGSSAGPASENNFDLDTTPLMTVLQVHLKHYLLRPDIKMFVVSAAEVIQILLGFQRVCVVEKVDEDLRVTNQ